MNIIAADDENLARKMLVNAIKKATPNSNVVDFAKPSLLLEYAKDNDFDVAFLDINMTSMTGIQLATKLKKHNPKVNIIFVTGYNEYCSDALKLHASGYIMKPVTPKKILKELEDLRYNIDDINDIQEDDTNKLLVKCFGNFEVFDKDSKPLKFDRSRAKEILAYLIYLNGATCSVKEISAVLFEDASYDLKQRNYIQQLMTSLTKALKMADLESVLIKNYNSIAIDISKVKCDYYDFEKGIKSAKSLFHGEFMTQYSWAEDIVGTLI